MLSTRDLRRVTMVCAAVVGAATVAIAPPSASAATDTDGIDASAVGTFETLTDDRGVLTVAVPVAWTDRSTSPGRRDDGGPRPTITAATNLQRFRDGWSDPGIHVTALRPTVDPGAIVAADDWSGVCNGGDVSAFSTAALTGEVRTWTDCGGTTASLSILGARSLDGTFAVFAQVQTLSAGDPLVQQILGSIAGVPGTNPGEVSVVVPVPVAIPEVPPDLLAGVVDATTHATKTDETGRLSVAMPVGFADIDGDPFTNDDQSNRPNLAAGVSIDAYYSDWTAPGLQVTAYPYTSEPYTLLHNLGWADGCEDSGVQTISMRGYSGLMQTWSNCGGTGSRIVQVAVAPTDASATVVLDIQLPTADNTDLIAALVSLTLEPA